MTKKQVNIKEIAEMAGVSVATVSRILNKNGRYSKKTEEKVLQIIKQTKYVPNMSAKSLRTSKSQVIGIIVPEISNPYFSTLVYHLQNQLYKEGFSCLICNSNNSLTLESSQIQSLIAQNVQGIIITSGTQEYPSLKDIPAIYVDGPALDDSDSFVSIHSDNEQGGYLAAQEIIDSGCRSILLVTWGSTANVANQISREQGFLRALKESKKRIKYTKVVADSTSIEDGRKVVKGYLKTHIKPDGIVALADTLAVGTLIALQENGLEVPKNVKLTGYDDVYLAIGSGPGLTSVKQNVPEMARLASSILLQMIEGKKIKKKEYILPVTLTKRNSTMKR